MNRRRDSEKHNKVKDTHSRIREDIRSRLEEFARIREQGSEAEIFAELVFCILTPQCKAESCWSTVEALRNRDLLFLGNTRQLADLLIKSIRFHNNKARCIVKARKRLLRLLTLLKSHASPRDLREWLVKNIAGLGYKEAGHFLRNMGLGHDLAILDRHILRTLVEHQIIPAIPSTLTKKRYLEIEEKMRGWAKALDMPLSHLDMVLWHLARGTIFK